jgi:hypothetical protein
MAVEEALAGRSDVALTVWDNQSDALLTREQLDLSRGQSVDAVLLPGLPAYLAALPGLPLDRPVVALGYEGPPPGELHPRLLHFGLDPATLGAQAARLAVDSLGASRLATLGPATRAAMRTVDGFRAAAAPSPSARLGEKQWYFHGARQLDHQRLAICGQVDGGPGPGCSWAAPARAPCWRTCWPACPPAVGPWGIPALLEAVQGRVPDGLDGRLLWVTDWLPASLAGLPDPQRRSWDAFRERVRQRHEREPGALESRAYESARLVLAALDGARRDGRGLEAALRRLDEPSLFGGRVRLAGGQARDALRLGWTGRQARVVGRVAVTKGND